MENKKKSEFNKVFSAWDILVIAFGAMIGWGWVVSTGDWINTGGVIGAMLGFVIGGVMIFFVGLTYAELTAALPQCGGEHVFSFRAMGPIGSYICTWAIVLGYVSVVCFEACALPTIITYIYPEFLQGYLYTVAGFDIYASWVAVAVIVAVFITYINIRGAKTAAFLQTVLTVIIGVVGILLAGWSSNNKFSLIGAMRSGAQMISYELSIGLSILTIIVLTDTMQFSEIVMRQADGWFIFKGHIPAVIAFIIYLIAGNAEVNRGPFDLPEAESELTAGYHTEYSGMHFGLFYVAEFVNLFIVSSIAATIFLGGWMPLHIPGLDGFNAVMDYIPGFVWFFAKALFVVWLLMWIKWTFPRLRIDQILTLEWKYLVPIGLVNLLLMVVVVVFKLHF